MKKQLLIEIVTIAMLLVVSVHETMADDEVGRIEILAFDSMTLTD